MIEHIKVDRIVNVSGLQEPQPLFIVQKTIRKMRKGEILEIIGSKFTIEHLAKALQKMKEFTLLHITQELGDIRCIIQINEVPPPSYSLNTP